VLYLLQYNLDHKLPDTDKRIYGLLAKFNAHCGISNPYRDLLETPDYQIQAENALTLGYHLDKTGTSRIYYYRDYYLSAILAPRIEQMPQNNYISPIIRTIQDYDEKHDTDFLATLQVYVTHLYDTAETSEELHIHRNTLLYRIHKIEELTGSSLKDYETFMHLMLSFYMMSYRDN
jgi:DNA-binding PucR family transcriptional regulator